MPARTESHERQTAVVGMWIFLLSDAVGFAALLVTLTALRLDRPSFGGELPLHRGLLVGGTVALLLVSICSHLANATERGDTARRLLRLAGLVLGLSFVGLQWIELSGLWDQVDARQSGAGQSYLALSFFHLAHLLPGLIALGLSVLRAQRPRPALALYWHLVDAMWIAIAIVALLLSGETP